MARQPGYRTDVTAGWPASAPATRAAFAQCLSIRAARVLTPRSVSQASNGLHRPGRVLGEGELVGVARVLQNDGATHHVRVTAEVLGRGVDNDVGTQVERALQVRRGERVVHDEQRAVLVGERGERRMSTIDSSGFVGVSAQISRGAPRPRPWRPRQGRFA